MPVVHAVPADEGVREDGQLDIATCRLSQGVPQVPKRLCIWIHSLPTQAEAWLAEERVAPGLARAPAECI